MAKNPLEANERIKRDYLEYRKYAGRLSEKSLDKEITAIERFDVWNGRKNFRRFHLEQAIGFCRHLETAINPATGRAFSKSTVNSTLSALRTFILWLSQREGFRKRISPKDADYFNISKRDAASLKAPSNKRAPSAEQARHVLAQMPAQTDVQKRDRAIIALLCLAAVRVKSQRNSAIRRSAISLKGSRMLSGCSRIGFSINGALCSETMMSRSSRKPRLRLERAATLRPVGSLASSGKRPRQCERSSSELSRARGYQITVLMPFVICISGMQRRTRQQSKSFEPTRRISGIRVCSQQSAAMASIYRVNVKKSSSVVGIVQLKPRKNTRLHTFQACAFDHSATSP